MNPYAKLMPRGGCEKAQSSHGGSEMTHPYPLPQATGQAPHDVQSYIQEVPSSPCSVSYLPSLWLAPSHCPEPAANNVLICLSGFSPPSSISNIRIIFIYAETINYLCFFLLAAMSSIDSLRPPSVLGIFTLDQRRPSCL